MYLEYFYCPHCGYETYDVSVTYSRQTASGKLYICPNCGSESSSISEYSESE